MFFGSGANLGIGISIQLNNQFSNRANAIVNSMNALNVNSQQLLRDNLTMVRNASVGMIAIGYATARGIQHVNKKFADYEYTLKSVQAVIGHMTSGELLQLDRIITQLGPKFGKLPTEVAQASLQLAKAGIEDVKSLRNMLEATMLISTAADVPLFGERGAAEMLINIMTMFGIATERASASVDMISMAANRSTIDVTDFFESVKYSGQVFRQLKVPFEDYATMIAVLGNAGLKGSIAGTTMANMGRYLVRSLTELRAGKGPLMELGIGVSDLVKSNGDLKSFDQIFGMLSEKIKHLPSTTQLALLEDIFGVRGARGTTIMNRLSEYEHIRKSILESTKDEYALQVAMKKLQSSKGLSSQLASVKELLDIKLGQVFLPFLMVALPIITKFLSMLAKFVETPFGKAAVWGVATFGILIGLVGLILLPLATFGLLLTNARLGMGALKVTAVWAFNAIVGSIQKAVFWMRAFSMAQMGGGLMRWPAGTMRGGKAVGGQFFNPKNMFKGMGGVGRLFGSIGRMGGGVLRTLGMFGKLIPVLGWVILAFQLLTDPIGTLRDLVRSLITPFLMLHQVIRFLASPFTGDESAYKLGDNLHDTVERVWDNDSWKEHQQYKKDYPGGKIGDNDMGNGTKLDTRNRMPILNLNVNVGGEKVLAKKINTQTENEVFNATGFKFGN